MTLELADPRRFPATAEPGAVGDAGVPARASAAVAAAAAEASLARSAQRDSEADDAIVDEALRDAFADRSGATLEALFAAAPSAAVYRHLWRRLGLQCAKPVDTGSPLGVALFALPLVVVCVHRDGGRAILPGGLPDAASFAALLREHRALAGNETLALAPSLAAAHAIAPRCLPALAAGAREAVEGGAPLDVAPQPIEVSAQESVHLRFVVGTALAAASAPLFGTAPAPGLASALARKLMAGWSAHAGVQAVALPRLPAALPQAWAEGLVAQREVSVQLFVSNALRRLRSRFGEPTAIVSAHALADGTGELRLSLSSPFSPRDAEGFRCPLFPFERVADATAVLEALLDDCRVADVRAEPGVHRDRDAATGLPLLFKAGGPATH